MNRNGAQPEKSDFDFYERIPKVELHLHLEGAIPHNAQWELIQKYGGDPSVPDIHALAQKFKYRDFTHFVETWDWRNQYLREYEDFTFIAEMVARDLAQQNIRYAEVFFSAPDFKHSGLITQKLAEAIRAGISRVPEIEIALVADLVRDSGPEKAAITLKEITEVKNSGIVGIGIGGTEHRFPSSLFKNVYETARQSGFYTSAHAGETVGPESIWDTICALHVDRIGHGTRAVEDEYLLNYLVEHAIPLEICPTSNLRIGVIRKEDEHPVRRFFERGIIVTVNTDDPKMFGTSLKEEYRLLATHLGFTCDEICSLILQGIRASWLPEIKKHALILKFKEDKDWLKTG